MTKKLRVLLIAYHFPPYGGAGSQRPSKFVKYLPTYDIDPIVVTRTSQSAEKWAPLDISLNSDIPTSTKIFRTESGIIDEGGRIGRCLSYFSLWNPMREWCQNVRDLGNKVGNSYGVDAVIATLSPFQSCIPAAQIADSLKVPWIADLRDPWALDEFQVYPTGLHRSLTRRLMKKHLRTASLIIMNTPEAANRVRKAFPEFVEKPIISLTNGYDLEDFEEESSPNRKKFQIVHAGHMHTADGLKQQRNLFLYNLLGRSERGVELLARSHFYILKALEAWKKMNPSIAKNVKFTLVGAASVVDKELARDSSVEDLVEFTGYQSHHETVRWITSADLLFLPMHSLPAERRSTIVPGKAYEYMASKRPILAAVPAGDARDFLIKSGNAFVCDPSDIAGMVSILAHQYQNWERGEITTQCNSSFVMKFERRVLAAELANQIRLVCASAS